ncbi:pupal cuticle protein 36a-like [Thrips palmi]|uniref:Pupal cuticle protein 36a-like n=1 Tax=Thrips palmi TaxID=161013 RepID=A0A6P8ZTK8_THRPL|nr:pupal cuticle protein 36a-like [Thrips palmi]
MRTVACIMMLAGCALAGRLENTYLPPPGAAQAGGSNLATPFGGAVSSTLAPPLIAQKLRSRSETIKGFNGNNNFNSGSAFNAGNNFNAGNAFNAGSAPLIAEQARPASLNSFETVRTQQEQRPLQAVNAYSGSFQQPTPRPALIIKQVNENPGDGTYTFSYETENGIQAQEQGQVRADGAEGLAAVQGAYAFTAPDNNQRYTVTYTADENGFLAYGDHLPTPPPVPAEILRALEQNAADEARGLNDDGESLAASRLAPACAEPVSGRHTPFNANNAYNNNNAFNANNAFNNNGYNANNAYNANNGYTATKSSSNSAANSNNNNSNDGYHY